MGITVKTLKEAYASYYNALVDNGVSNTYKIFGDFREFLETLSSEKDITDCALDIVTWMDKYKILPLFDFMMIQDLVPYSQLKGSLDRQLGSYMETCYLASIFPRYMRFELSKIEVPFYLRARNCTPITHLRLDDPEYPEYASDLFTWAKLNDRVLKEFKAMHLQLNEETGDLDIEKTKEYLMKCSDEKIFFIWRSAARLAVLLATDSVVYHRAYPIASWYMRSIMYVMDQRRNNQLHAFTR